MKKEFIKPELAVSIFNMENIVTDSVVPTNEDSVTTSLTSEMNAAGVTNGGMAKITLTW